MWYKPVLFGWQIPKLRQRMLTERQERNLIIGGDDIPTPQRYPYYVAIDKNNGVIVSGALIAPDIVLSAGHVALDAMTNVTIKIGPFAVHEPEPFVEIMAVKSWKLFENWTFLAPGFFAEDYMIIQLDGRSSHKPIRLNRDPTVPIPGTIVTMMGFGWTNATHTSPPLHLQQAELMTITNDECEAAHDPKRPEISYIQMAPESVLCTKSPPNTTRDGW